MIWGKKFQSADTECVKSEMTLGTYIRKLPPAYSTN
jgi:hypothetical protein